MASEREESRRLLIRGGSVVTEEGVRRADVLVVGERIAAVADDLGSAAADVDEVVAAEGLLVMPGFVDSHTHLDCPSDGPSTCDDFDTGTRAALAGGTTTIVDFAFQTDGSLLAGHDEWMRKAAGRAHLDYGFHMAIVDPTPQALAEIPELVDRGVTSFKAFMCELDGSLLGEQALAVILDGLKESGGLLQVHAEDGAEILRIAEGVRDRDPRSPIGHALSHPVSVEVAAVRQVIDLSRRTGQPVFVVHVSSAEAVDEIERAQREGLPVHAETCVHYLTLTVDELAREGFEGAKFVCSPPLRGASDQERLWEALRSGVLRICTSDHCPYNYTDKELGREDFTKIPAGLPTIEHRLNLLWEFGVTRDRLSPSELVRVAATEPARTFGLSGKGDLAVGYDADIVLFDPEGSSYLSAEHQNMNVDYSAFEGVRCAGEVVRVISRGESVFADGKVLSRPGRGRYLARGRSPLGRDEVA